MERIPADFLALLVEEGRRGKRITGVRIVNTDEDATPPWLMPPSRMVKRAAITGPHPEQLKIVASDQLYLEKTALTPPLRNAFVRLAAFHNPEYESIGYSIHLPASAVPGWPADVPLPSESSWKTTYAASVRRLVRDGVDSPLGNLFLHAASSFPDNVEGAARARSASEAFLYRRLETLSETRGLFRLNDKLAIPFAGFPDMEVDLSCRDVHIAIEIDGRQHLNDPAAYRRDRSKDLLLQEYGWIVMRVLADDIAEKLDELLDCVLRLLVARGR